MIYSIKNPNIINEYYHNEIVYNNKKIDAELQARYVKDKDNPLYIGSLYIPRAYAREETKIAPKDASLVDHYEIALIRQTNDSEKTSTYVFARLPKTGEFVAVEIFKFGQGADFLKRDHTKILRGTYDELDRRIIKGFCIKNAKSLIFNSHTVENGIVMWLKPEAKFYKASDQPKRLKSYKEDYGIFSDVEFLEPLAL